MIQTTTMSQIALLATLTLSSASASAQTAHPAGEWHPALDTDARGPCPMMNTLANHGFINRNGLNLTEAHIIKGLGDGLNFDADLAELMFEMALPANPEPNATFFTLEQLNVHNVLEHDASLSRMDAEFGSNHEFSAEVFASSKRFWTNTTLTAEMLTNSKLMRQIESRAFNPNYSFDATVEQFSLGELAAPIIAFGDTEKGTVDRALVEFFFENEKLPYSLGWTQKNVSVKLNEILTGVEHIRKATNLLTGNVTSAPEEAGHGSPERRDLHSGLGRRMRK